MATEDDAVIIWDKLFVPQTSFIHLFYKIDWLQGSEDDVLS